MTRLHRAPVELVISDRCEWASWLPASLPFSSCSRVFSPLLCYWLHWLQHFSSSSPLPPPLRERACAAKPRAVRASRSPPRSNPLVPRPSAPGPSPTPLCLHVCHCTATNLSLQYILILHLSPTNLNLFYRPLHPSSKQRPTGLDLDSLLFSPPCCADYSNPTIACRALATEGALLSCLFNCHPDRPSLVDLLTCPATELSSSTPRTLKHLSSGPPPNYSSRLPDKENAGQIDQILCPGFDCKPIPT